MGRPTVAPDDPGADDVRALLDRHLAFTTDSSPPEDCHALDLAGLLDPSVSFFGVRHDGRLVGIGALKELDPAHGEIKSMHTAHEQRRQGTARLMLDHLLDLARRRGYPRVSLETGSQEVFAPARRLYRGAGFVDCAPFADYAESPNSTYMTMALDAENAENAESPEDAPAEPTRAPATA